MTRAAIYARYSSDNQRAESITAQVRARTEFCRARGYIIAKQYVDEARTGTNEDRPAFRSMIRDAKTGDTFQVVVVHKIDRFARDRYDDAFYKRELSKAGVRRESVVEYFGDGPQAELVENIMADFAAYFTDNLRWETKKGLGVNASEARSCSGKPPLGYDYDDQKRYVINEIEAPVVRLIFVMYDAGHTYSEILIALTPYRSKRGRPFTPNSLHDILRNEKYMGRFVYNKRDTSGKTRNNHAFGRKQNG